MKIDDLLLKVLGCMLLIFGISMLVIMSIFVWRETWALIS